VKVNVIQNDKKNTLFIDGDHKLAGLHINYLAHQGNIFAKNKAPKGLSVTIHIPYL